MNGHIRWMIGVILSFGVNICLGADPKGVMVVKALGGEVREAGGILEVSLVHTTLKDADLKSLHFFPELEVLGLDRTQISDVGLKHLKPLVRLRLLRLSHTAVTDAGLRHLGMLPLEELNLAGTRITDAGLK